MVWVDAHADFNTAELTPSGNIHGMPVACLAGHGPDELTTMAGAKPAVATEDIRQVGLRSVDAGEKASEVALAAATAPPDLADDASVRDRHTAGEAFSFDDGHEVAVAALGAALPEPVQQRLAALVPVEGQVAVVVVVVEAEVPRLDGAATGDVDGRVRLLDRLGPQVDVCLLYTSPSPRDRPRSRMPSSA